MFVSSHQVNDAGHRSLVGMLSAVFSIGLLALSLTTTHAFVVEPQRQWTAARGFGLRMADAGPEFPDGPPPPPQSPPEDDNAKADIADTKKSMVPSSASTSRTKEVAKEALNRNTVIIQGNSLRTWSVVSSTYKKVHLSITTDGRPLNANIELWHGPDYTPAKMSVYVEDGLLTPFNTIIVTKPGTNTVAVVNKSPLEFPLMASLAGGKEDDPTTLLYAANLLPKVGEPRLIQGGGAVASFPFDPAIEQVQVCLKADERNLKGRVELMQGPNNDKQVIEYYASSGYKNPFFCIFRTPGSGNVVRIINKNTVEFPFTAYVEPFMHVDRDDPSDGITLN